MQISSTKTIGIIFISILCSQGALASENAGACSKLKQKLETLSKEQESAGLVLDDKG